jgi:uncharacterized protein YyaL (SSP411 family)
VRGGRLLRTWKAGRAKLNGYLEDHTHLIDGLIEFYQTTFDPRWYLAARELAEAMLTHYAAPVGFYDTSDDHETLITRPRETQDNASPSGNGMAVTVLARLVGLALEPRYSDLAEQSLASMGSLMARHPLAFAQWLIAAAYLLSPPREIAIIGDPKAPDTRVLLQICQAGYRPNQVVAAGLPGTDPPLLGGREMLDGKATAYLCEDFICRRPVNDPETFRALLTASGETT